MKKRDILKVAGVVGIGTAVAGILMPEMVLLGIAVGLSIVAAMATRENWGHWTLALGIAITGGVVATLFFTVRPVERSAFVAVTILAALTMIGIGYIAARDAERDKRASTLRPKMRREARRPSAPEILPTEGRRLPEMAALPEVRGGD